MMGVDRDKEFDRYSDRDKDRHIDNDFDHALEHDDHPHTGLDFSNLERAQQRDSYNALGNTSAELADLKLEAVAGKEHGNVSPEKLTQGQAIESGGETNVHIRSSIAGWSPPGGINTSNLADGVVPQDPEFGRAEAANNVKKLINDFSRDKISLV